jgi:serine/threonine-protein kinase
LIGPLGRRGALLVVVVAAAAIALMARSTGVLNSLELSSIDARFHVRGNEKPPSNLVIVGLDQRSLAALAGPGGLVPRTVHAELIDRLHRDGARVIGVDFQFTGKSAGALALERSISRARPVVLATHDTDSGPVPVLGLQDVSQLGAVLGSVAAPTDSDGLVRHVLYAPVQTPSFAVQVARLALGHPVSEADFPDNSAWIDYAGPSGTYPTVSFADVVAGRVNGAAFRGKVVLIGATDPALGDIVQTPVSGTPMAGVEVHANAVATILDGFPLHAAPGWANVLLVLVATAIPALLALRLTALYVIGGSLAVLVILLVGVQLAFDAGMIVSLVYPVLGLVLSAAGAATVDSLETARELRSLSEAVSRLARRIGPGQVIGNYRIEKLVGQGGMAVVYRATQLSLGRRVALKVITPEQADDAEFRARFQRESMIAASIDHPNVVPIYESGAHGDLLFIAMRFIEGVDLRTLLESEGPLAPERASRVIDQAAGALAAAHAHGLVHRDVKPANMLIDTSAGGHLYLTDFGITRRVDATTVATKAGMPIGTVDYMPPEQVNGEPVDRRADVYALGCVLYQILTGSVPFERDSEIAKLFAHVSAEAPPASERRSGLTPRVDEVIRRAMAKRPEDRYSSVAEFAQAAAAALAEIHMETAPSG